MSSCPSPTHPRRHSRQRQGDVLVLGVRSDLVACGGEGLRIQRRYLTSSPVTEALTWHGRAMVAIVGIVLFIRCPAGRWNRYRSSVLWEDNPPAVSPAGLGTAARSRLAFLLSVWPFHRSSLLCLRSGLSRHILAALRYSTTLHFGTPALYRFLLPDRQKNQLMEREPND